MSRHALLLTMIPILALSLVVESGSVAFAVLLDGDVAPNPTDPALNAWYDGNEYMGTAALQPGDADVYLEGKFGAIAPRGRTGDGQTSVAYNAVTGELSVDPPAGGELTSIYISSVSGIFTGQPVQHIEGDFDVDTDNEIFVAMFGATFGAISFGRAAEPGLSHDFVLDDLTVVGSLAGGGPLGDVDLVYIAVPEPCAVALFGIGMVALTAIGRRRPDCPQSRELPPAS
jgi:hypothetical protein